MSVLLNVLGVGISAVTVTHAGAWLTLSAMAMRRPTPCRPAERPWRFAVIVPAHNEEGCIGETLESLAADEFEPRPELFVVADNCSDSTASIARNLGATTLERFDSTHRGKAYALDFGIAVVESRAVPPDAYIILDADSTVQPGFFAAIASRLDAGAEVVQAEYRVLSQEDARTRLRALAFTLVHYARPLGAQRLGLGMGLKGNGMAFRRALVANGMPGFGITEDAAASLELARRGLAASFEPGAVVLGRMAPSYSAAVAQDRRWEGGRLSMLPRAVLIAAVATSRGRWMAAGAAMDVAALPLTVVGLLAGVGLGLAAAGFGSFLFAAAGCLMLVAYPFAGWAAARVPIRDLGVLAQVPRFVAHKLRVFVSLARSGAPRNWERTERGGEA
ncbi:MAG: glycosyltransferase family 2 protein [Dehalococcoidia bacterium]